MNDDNRLFWFIIGIGINALGAAAGAAFGVFIILSLLALL